MSRDEALERLREIKEVGGGDVEMDHMFADKVLLDLIDDSDISKAWNAIGKWFA